MKTLACLFRPVAVVCLALTATAHGEEALTPSKAEEFLAAALANDQTGVVDLAQCPDGPDVRAGFLYGLLSTTEGTEKRRRVWIKHAVWEGAFDLAKASVAYDVRLESCVFKGPVHATGAVFARGLSLVGSTFLAPVDLRGAVVAQDLNLDQTVFEQDMTLASARITGALQCGAARFAALVDWRWVSCAVLLGSDVTFNGPVKFDSLNVGGTVWFAGATFAHNVSFGYARIREEFALPRARFEKAANFYGMEVGGTLSLVTGDEGPAVFAGEARFGDARIGRNLAAWSVKFTSSKHPVLFDGTKVEGSCYFKGAEFAGPVSFILAEIGGNLEAPEAQFTSGLSEAELDRATNGRLHHDVDFGSLRVAGFVLFQKTRFQGTVSFRNAAFGNLHLEGVDFAGGRSSVRLDGFSYQHIRAAKAEKPLAGGRDGFWIDQRASWTNLRKILRDQAEYSAFVFENLEGYFRRLGQPELADDVFIERKQLERRRVLAGFDWFGSWVLCLLVGYGRHPEYALAWSAVFVVAGWVGVFRRTHMELKKPQSSTEPPYSGFWYSLDLFVPVINLESNDLWQPKPLRWYAYYTAFHKLTGAILVPLGLAAITGIIR